MRLRFIDELKNTDELKVGNKGVLLSTEAHRIYAFFLIYKKYIIFM